MTGGYQFSCGRTNRKRHETNKSCSLILTLESKIFTGTAVSFPTVMQLPKCHSATTSGGNPSRRGAPCRFVLYFLFLFEQFHHHPELPIGMRSVHSLCILLDQISTGIFRMERSTIRGTLSPFSTTYLYAMDCTVDFARETSRGDRVSVIATVPLTKDEDRMEFRRVHLLMLDRGLAYYEL